MIEKGFNGMEFREILELAQLPAMGVIVYFLFRLENRSAKTEERVFALIDRLLGRIEFIEKAQGIEPRESDTPADERERGYRGFDRR